MKTLCPNRAWTRTEHYAISPVWDTFPPKTAKICSCFVHAHFGDHAFPNQRDCFYSTSPVSPAMKYNSAIILLAPCVDLQCRTLSADPTWRQTTQVIHFLCGDSSISTYLPGVHGHDRHPRLHLHRFTFGSSRCLLDPIRPIKRWRAASHGLSLRTASPPPSHPLPSCSYGAPISPYCEGQTMFYTSTNTCVLLYSALQGLCKHWKKS